MDRPDHTAQAVPVCADCGRIIDGLHAPGKRIIQPDEVADMSRRHMGRVLCSGCMIRAMAAQMEEVGKA